MLKPLFYTKSNLLLRFAISLPIFLFFIITFFSCKTLPKESTVNKETITLLFAGDIMAHKPNFNMKDYNKIWQDISPIIKKADFSFANIESPIDSELPYSSFPNFNMKTEYPKATIDAGFNVFSIINNHTNDQGLKGMIQTLEWTSSIENETKNNERQVFFSGLNKNPNDELSYKIIKKDNWTILFIAITEILNRPNYKEYMNYIPYTQKGRNNFIEKIKKIKESTPCDIFIISIHTDEEEYISPVLEKRKIYYKELLNCGVDIIWANHPHIIRERDIFTDEKTGIPQKVIMYGNGNTISGQRWQPQFDNPNNDRENTGDGLMFEITFSKKHNTDDTKDVIIEETKPFYITTYINTNWEFIIKNLDTSFVEYLNNVKRVQWANYIQNRIKKSNEYKENIICQ